MNMNINKTGNNTAIIEIKNRNPVLGNDTGLNSGNNPPGNLHVRGNKTPVNEHVAALYDELIHPEASSQAYLKPAVSGPHFVVLYQSRRPVSRGGGPVFFSPLRM